MLKVCAEIDVDVNVLSCNEPRESLVRWLIDIGSWLGQVAIRPILGVDVKKYGEPIRPWCME